MPVLANCAQYARITIPSALSSSLCSQSEGKESLRKWSSSRYAPRCAGLPVSKKRSDTVCLLTCACHSSRHRPGSVCKGIVLKSQILLWDVGIRCYGVSLKFLVGELSGVFRQILLILIDGFQVVVAEDGCFIGVAADKNWDLEFFAFRVDLCGLLWKYPSIDDGVK